MINKAITTFPVEHSALISGLKKAGILASATVDYPGSVLQLNQHLAKHLGKVLVLRSDGKAYTLAKWNGPGLSRRTLEQFLSSNGSIRVTVRGNR